MITCPQGTGAAFPLFPFHHTVLIQYPGIIIQYVRTSELKPPIRYPISDHPITIYDKLRSKIWNSNHASALLLLFCSLVFIIAPSFCLYCTLCGVGFGLGKYCIFLPV